MIHTTKNVSPNLSYFIFSTAVSDFPEPIHACKVKTMVIIFKNITNIKYFNNYSLLNLFLFDLKSDSYLPKFPNTIFLTIINFATDLI